MLNHIRKFFDEFMATESPDARDQDMAVRCAAAALLLEMAHLDDVLEPTEQAAILNAVREGFELSPEQAEELIACANEERTQATDYHQASGTEVKFRFRSDSQSDAPAMASRLRPCRLAW